MPRNHPKGDGLSGRQVDVVIRGVGRVVRAWGTDKRKERAKRKALLFELAEAGQLTVLAAFQRGDLSWEQLLGAKREKRLTDDALASDLALSVPLWDTPETVGALTRTLATLRLTPATRQAYLFTLAALRDTGHLPATATVGHLLTVDWGAIWSAIGKSAAWRNRIRATLSTFASAYFGHRFHPQAIRVRVAMGKKEKEPVVPANLSAAEFWRLMDAVPDALVPVYVTLAATGLRVAEYLALGADALSRFPTIVVRESKAGRAEVVQVDPALEPYVRAAIPCRLPVAKRTRRKAAPTDRRVPRIHQRDPRYHRLYRELRKASAATGIPASVHTLRHFYIGEGVQHLPQAFVQQAARHQTPQMTARYAAQRDAQQVANAVGQALRTQRDKVRDDVSLAPVSTPSNPPRTDTAAGRDGR